VSLVVMITVLKLLVDAGQLAGQLADLAPRG
jgi:hypothetical protein